VAVEDRYDDGGFNPYLVDERKEEEEYAQWQEEYGFDEPEEDPADGEDCPPEGCDGEEGDEGYDDYNWDEEEDMFADWGDDYAQDWDDYDYDDWGDEEEGEDDWDWTAYEDDTEWVSEEAAFFNDDTYWNDEEEEGDEPSITIGYDGWGDLTADEEEVDPVDPADPS